MIGGRIKDAHTPSRRQNRDEALKSTKHGNWAKMGKKTGENVDVKATLLALNNRITASLYLDVCFSDRNALAEKKAARSQIRLKFNESKP